MRGGPLRHLPTVSGREQRKPRGSATMVSVLAVFVAISAIVLLFILDPSGAIADSGFPGFREMDWKQLAAWSFRLVGVAVAFLLILTLWLRYRAPSYGIQPLRSSRYLANTQPGSMPAAAVSVLEHREVTARTLLASVIEMCQRGDLRVEAVRMRGGYRYRLVQQGPPKFEWERSIRASLLSRPMTVQELHNRMNDHSHAIGDRLGEYLQGRGLFPDNPVRFSRQNLSEGAELALLSGVLMGIGCGFWATLWLTQWWASALIGAAIGFTYWMIAAPMNTGMPPPTRAGGYQIEQLLGPRDSLTGSDSMLAYAVGLDAAQPWLRAEASAPYWFSAREAASLRDSDIVAAYFGFLHDSAWGLAGRSDDVVEAAVVFDDSMESDWTARRKTADEYEHQRYRAAGTVEEPGSVGQLGRFLIWFVSLTGAGALVLAVLFSLDIVSPRAKPCPMDSPTIPTPAQIATVGDLFNDECVRVSGTLVFKEVDSLVLEIDRGTFQQQVTVLTPEGLLKAVSIGEQVTLGGRLRVEDRTYEVDLVPNPQPEREWRRNLQENFEALWR